MDQPAIQFDRVNKAFGTETILQDFNMEVQPGELVSIVGPSGCGKSTLLRMIAGLECADSGKVVLSDESPGSDTPSVDPVTRTAFVFQESNLLPWLTAIDNVALPFRITGLPVNRARISDALSIVGLSSDSHRKYPAQLSGGMKMRVSIARALVTDPRILLLDEPFAALDDLLRTDLNMKIMDIWRKSRQTMLFVTHNIGEAIFVSQKVLVLGKGKSAPSCISVDIEYPRKTSVKSSRQFADLFSQVSTSLEKLSVASSETEGSQP